MARTVDIERALKDDEYLRSLTPEELASVPWNPAGDLDVTESKLDTIVGGRPCGSTGSCLASKRTRALGCDYTGC